MAKEAIKRVAEAEAKAAEIIAAAEAEAADIIEKAKWQAAELAAEAETSAKQLITNKRKEAEQAAAKSDSGQAEQARQLAQRLKKNTDSRRSEAIRLVIDTLVS